MAEAKWKREWRAAIAAMSNADLYQHVIDSFREQHPEYTDSDDLWMTERAEEALRARLGAADFLK